MSINFGDPIAENRVTYFPYTCDVCGYTGKMRKDHRQKGIGCSACNGKKVLVGFNDVATKRPDLVKYFSNPEDAKTVTPYSHRNISFRCPHCGFESQHVVSHISRRGFICRVCGDNVSYPNKFFASILRQAGIDFEPEKTFTWSARKRYDFYLPQDNAIVEVHGCIHYVQSGYVKNISDVKKNDIAKMKMANDNGIASYYVIDAKDSDPQYIGTSLFNSEFAQKYDISGVSIQEAHVYAISNLAWRCCELWNDGSRSTTNIGRIVGLSQCTVCEYLKRFSAMGLCDYDRSISWQHAQHIASTNRKKAVICIEDNYIFDSIKECAEYYGLSPNVVSNCINEWSFSNKLNKTFELI